MDTFFMTVRDLFAWVDNFPSSIALRESQYVWGLTLVAHVVTISIFGGLVVMMDLRLLGVGNMGTPFSQVQRRLFPWQMLGMVLSTITGLALLFAQPLRFYGSVFFWLKLLLIMLAGLNAMAFHYIAYYSVATWDSGGVPPFAARLAGALGIVLWASAIVSGRFIPYAITWFPQE